MGSTLRKIQPSLLFVAIKKDVVYTPRWLAKGIVEYFQPSGLCLDPCMGDGAFYDFLPKNGRDWCEIKKGRDFLTYLSHVDWVIGNPPYSCLLEWVRHSFKVADNVVYLLPLHRVMTSASFLDDVYVWGGLKEVLFIGTGTDVGFSFGHALAVVHYQRGWHGGTKWTKYQGGMS